MMMPQLSHADSGTIFFPDGSSVTYSQDNGFWLQRGTAGFKGAATYMQFMYTNIKMSGHGVEDLLFDAWRRIVQVACGNGVSLESDYIPDHSPSTPNSNSNVGNQGNQAANNTCNPQNKCEGLEVHKIAADCTDTFVESCTFGCANSMCLPPPPTADLTVVPTVVQANSKTQITWGSTNAQSCNLSSTNGDMGSGTKGSQSSNSIVNSVTYTLTCIGADFSTIKQTATVQLAPVFHEQ